jgi:uncharacterized protein YecT (DUF1311 family)
MNQRATDRLERLDRRMNRALQLLMSTGEIDSDMLEQEQDAWRIYRDRHGELADSPWENGSMRPFIVFGAMSRLTKERCELLEQEISRS